MSVYKKQELIESYPAYNIYKRDTTHRGYIEITHEDILGVKGNGYYALYSPGSVVSYTLQYNDDPIAALERAKERGENLYWLTEHSVVISSNPAPAKTVVAVQDGDKVRFEGREFTIRVIRGMAKLVS